MGSEGQNSPNNTPDAERKRPWEIFSEKETAVIRISKKHFNRREKKRFNKEKYKTRLLNIKIFVWKHKRLSFSILISSFLLLCGGVFGAIYIINVGRYESTRESSGPGVSFEETNYENPFDKMTIKTAPSPDDAHYVVTTKLHPILVEGIFDTGTTNFSKFEDNYDVFAKTLESDYEKTCYYLAMIELMLAFDEDAGAKRAEYLLERFDEKKTILDDTQYFFYLSTRISLAIYKKDVILFEKYQDERNKKYPTGASILNLNTGKLISDKDELQKIREKNQKNIIDYGDADD